MWMRGITHRDSIKGVDAGPVRRRGGRDGGHGLGALAPAPCVVRVSVRGASVHSSHSRRYSGEGANRLDPSLPASHVRHRFA